MLHVLTIFSQSSLEGIIAALFKTSDCNYWSHFPGGAGGGDDIFNRCRSNIVKQKEDIWRAKLYMK